MAEKVLAAVRTAASTTEIREYPMPDVPEDAALLKMEVAGICGTDVRLYQEPPNAKPTIMGHENIGYIAKCGREFTRRKGFAYGRGGRPVQQPELLRSVLSAVDLTYQNLDSVELGVTTVDTYFDTLGGMSRDWLRAHEAQRIAVIGHGTFFHALTGQWMRNCEVLRWSHDAA